MLNRLLTFLFGCVHARTSFPQSPKGGLGIPHVTCLDCGAEFAYQWEAMRMGERLRAMEPRDWQGAKEVKA